MSIFEPIKLQWQGKDYEIPADRVMRVLQALEAEGFGLAVLGQMRQQMQMARIATAYALILRLAGASATDADVYAAMFADPDDMANVVATALNTLEAMFVPPDFGEKKSQSEPQAKKRKSSKKRTSSQ